MHVSVCLCELSTNSKQKIQRKSHLLSDFFTLLTKSLSRIKIKSSSPQTISTCRSVRKKFPTTSSKFSFLTTQRTLPYPIFLGPLYDTLKISDFFFSGFVSLGLNCNPIFRNHHSRGSVSVPNLVILKP